MPNTGVTMNSPRQGCLSLHLESWEIPKFNANFGRKKSLLSNIKKKKKQ